MSKVSAMKRKAKKNKASEELRSINETQGMINWSLEDTEDWTYARYEREQMRVADRLYAQETGWEFDE
jgi:hypothetical protein